MKKNKQNLMVNTSLAIVFAVVTLGACSSKDTVNSDNASVTSSSPQTTVAQAKPDSSNLGSGSSGRGR